MREKTNSENLSMRKIHFYSNPTELSNFYFSLLFSTADASDELKSKTFTNPVKVDDDILQRKVDRDDKSLDF